MDDNDTCVCCGQYAGEGRQVCVECEKESVRVTSGTMSYPEYALAKRVLALEGENERLRELLEEAQEEIQNCYGRDTSLTERIWEALKGGGDSGSKPEGVRQWQEHQRKD